MAKQVVLRINGKEVENSFGKLLGVTKKLEEELKKLPVGTEAFAKKMKKNCLKLRFCVYLQSKTIVMYTLEFSKKAIKSLRGITSVYQNKILLKLDELTVNPFENANVKALKGEQNTYRLRVSDCRVIFTIENNELIILVIDIDHRKNIYKE